MKILMNYILGINSPSALSEENEIPTFISQHHTNKKTTKSSAIVRTPVVFREIS